MRQSIIGYMPDHWTTDAQFTTLIYLWEKTILFVQIIPEMCSMEGSKALFMIALQSIDD